MRKIILMCILCFIVSFFACQIQQVGTSNTGKTLSNGTVITMEEQAKLDSLKPEADRILTEILGKDVRVINNVSQINAIKERVTDLLKSNFGEDYKKFIIEKDLKPSIAANAISKSASISTGSDVLPVISDSSIMKSVSGSTSVLIWYYSRKLIGWANYSEEIHYYYLTAKVGTVILPWFSYNYATQNLTQYTLMIATSSNTSGNGTSLIIWPVSYQYISIVDQGIEYGYEYTNTDSGAAVGLIIYGCWPSTASIVITHNYIKDPKIFYKGYADYVWLWGV